MQYSVYIDVGAESNSMTIESGQVQRKETGSEGDEGGGEGFGQEP